MLLEECLHRHDGIAHTSEIYAAGFSKQAVAVAVVRGMLRVRRSWIALPGSDPHLLAAIRAGGRLTCISKARRLGLWVPEGDDDVHIVAPPRSGTMRAQGVHVHWSNGPAPVNPRAVSDPLLNVLHHTARCLDAAAALAVWESALNRMRDIGVSGRQQVWVDGHPGTRTVMRISARADQPKRAAASS